MGGKPETWKTTNSSSGHTSLELCHRQQCSASTCAGFAELLDEERCHQKLFRPDAGILGWPACSATTCPILERGILKWAAVISPLRCLPFCVSRHQTHVSWCYGVCFSEHLGEKERLDTGALEGTGRLQTYSTTISLTTEDVILLPF